LRDGAVRIIAGRWRGRPLRAPPGRETRPTADRVREAWMSALEPLLGGARVLDLFAGSGALGLEALSRGAAHVTFVERAGPALRALAENVHQLGAGAEVEIVRADALAYVQRLAERAFDVALADPPYGQGLAVRGMALGGARPSGCATGANERPYSPLWRHPAHLDPGEPMSDARAASTAIYPGSFDPFTNGHEDIVRRSLRFVDGVVVAVAHRATTVKRGVFPVAERVELIETIFADEPRVSVAAFEGLLVDFARTRSAPLIIRGLRAVSDFEYEFQMALMNRQLWPELETLFLAPDVNYSFLSASLVREIAELGGDIRGFVAPVVRERLLARVGRPASAGH
jgi:pantetheine-phosphate adenylyltransferase